MATVATLTIDLIGQSGKLRSELGKASKSTKSWAQKTRKQVNSVGKLMAGVGVAGAAALTATYANAAKEADALAKTADKLAILPERLAGIQYAGELTGVAVETTNKGLQNMVKTVGEASQGIGLGVRAFDQLNLSVSDLSEMSPDEQFSTIAEAMNKVENQTDKLTLATQLFGTRGAGLINTLALGADGLNAMQVEAEALGITLTRVDLAKIEKANDDFTKAQKVTGAFGKVLASEVSPIVSALATMFVDSAKEAGGFGQVAQKVVNGVAGGIGIMADGLHGFKLLWEGVKVVALNALSGMVSGVAWLDAGISRLINLVPGLSATANADLQNIAGSFAQSATEATIAFQTALMTPIPSESIKAWVADVQEKAQIAAEEVAAEKPATLAAIAKSAGEDELTGIDVEGFKERNKKKEVSLHAHLQRTAAINLGASKKAQAVTKAAALADATMTGFKAIQSALAAPPGFPYNLPGVAIATAMTAANIQGIKGTSFEGGGFTGYGARTGGVDGRGGFPAVLHPNETVIDHTKGGSASSTKNVNISINAIDSSGFEELLSNNRAALANLIGDLSNDGGRINPI